MLGRCHGVAMGVCAFDYCNCGKRYLWGGWPDLNPRKDGWPPGANIPAHTDIPQLGLDLQLCKGSVSVNMHEHVCVHGYVPRDCWN